jgi:hypothetical protein
MDVAGRITRPGPARVSLQRTLGLLIWSLTGV